MKYWKEQNTGIERNIIKSFELDFFFFYFIFSPLNSFRFFVKFFFNFVICNNTKFHKRPAAEIYDICIFISKLF